MKWCYRAGAFFAALQIFNSPLVHASETVTYTYDELGRLRAVSSAGSVNNGKAQSIIYDAAGNRTGYTSSDPNSGPANISIADASVTEGGTLNFTVTRSGNTSISASVNFASASGTATSGSDFSAVTGTLSFASGETSKNITVTTMDDIATEPTESMTVGLSGASSGVTITRPTATGSIVDNDSGWASTLTIGQTTWMIDISPYGTIPVTYTGYWEMIIGSMSNTTYGTSTIGGLYTSGSMLLLTMSGSTSPPNSGWTSITVPGLGNFSRSAATYSAPTTAMASWQWTVPSGAIANGTVVIQ